LSTHLGGEGAVDTVPQNGGANVTMIGALSLQGLDAMMTVDGATHGDVLRAYVEQVLGPNLGAGDVVMKIIAADLGGCLPLLMQRLDGQALSRLYTRQKAVYKADTPVQCHRIEGWTATLL
jgi:hypothetical protein